MAFPAGTQVVDRDRAVLVALGIARYLTIEQLSRLIFAGRDERVARRRLKRLSQPGPAKLDPLVRAVAYRSATGAPLKAWALTEAGYAVAQRLVPYIPVPRKDVGPAFLEHTLLLNDVFVGLTTLALEAGERSTPALSDLPFRWVAESGEYLAFEYYDRHAQAVAKARIRPDAMLEIGSPPRRLFLECETGAHTIVSSDPTSTGATNAKIARYAQLLAGAVGQHDTRTPYAAMFADRLPAVLVFLVHSERRRDAIRTLTAAPEKRPTVNVRAYTFSEAIDVLASVARGVRVVTAPASVTVTASELRLIQMALGTRERPVDRGGGQTKQTAASDDADGASHAVEEARRLVATLRASMATQGVGTAAASARTLRTADAVGRPDGATRAGR